MEPFYFPSSLNTQFYSQETSEIDSLDQRVDDLGQAIYKPEEDLAIHFPLGSLNMTSDLDEVTQQCWRLAIDSLAADQLEKYAELACKHKTEETLTTYLHQIPQCVGQFVSLIDIQCAIENFISVREQALPFNAEELFYRAVGVFLTKELEILKQQHCIDEDSAAAFIYAFENRHPALFAGTQNMEAIPYSVGLLTHLTHLTITRSKITQIPDSIRYLTQLQVLDLRQNLITDLPNCLVSCKQLHTLRLSSNRFTKNLWFFVLLENLHTLDLEDNLLIETSNITRVLYRIQHLDLRKRVFANEKKHGRDPVNEGLSKLQRCD